MNKEDISFADLVIMKEMADKKASSSVQLRDVKGISYWASIRNGIFEEQQRRLELFIDKTNQNEQQ